MRQRYVARNREGRTRMIDEVCEQWGYSRKHAIMKRWVSRSFLTEMG